MTKIKNFFLNGQLYYVEERITISDLLHYFNFNDSLLVLEYNNLICDKKHWKEIWIQKEDKIEIVTIVGGG